ncbi:D-aminoacylase [Erythrobacter litoralis]|nr:D-aminoacylase [Erythrobacter litoralis]
MFDTLIKNGTIVDGTGAGARKADIRIANGEIVEIAEGLEKGPLERLIDASDCYVTPGFIETHNHYDAPMWWNPNLEPMSGYGVTTSVNGNCGFAAAPVSNDPEARDTMIKIFSFFEDIPITPFRDELPWDWSTWGEYRDSMLRNLRVPVNFEFYCGHIAIRLAVMGMDATERAASTEEIGEMQDLLREALDAGALGLSSNTMDYDGQGNPVPTILAADEEFTALFDVLDEYEDKTFQIMMSVFQRYEGEKDLARFDPLLRGRKFRTLWAGVPTLKFQMARLPNTHDIHQRFKDEGREMYTTFHHVPPTTNVNFFNSLTFAQSNNLVWHELIETKDEAGKYALLDDPDWRTRARKAWDEDMYPQAYFRRPETVTMIESESGHGPFGIGVTLADVIEQSQEDHASDALAEWLKLNGLGSTLVFVIDRESDKMLADLFKDPYAIGNVSDSGAHGQMLCGIGDHIDLIKDYVVKKGLLTIEEAIHNCTGKLAAVFGLHDRGTLETGKVADIAVWNIDEIERRPTIRMFDVPDGTGGRTWRYTREAAPMRLTMVAGYPTFQAGFFTGQYPGKIAGYEPTGSEELAEAAE